MWFDSWGDVARVLLVGAAAYVTLVVVLRVSGKRTLGQLNAFDFIVTVALGSTLATILLSSEVSFIEGAAALALLALLQLVVAFASSRSERLREAVTASPTLVVWDGELDRVALEHNRLAESEVLQAIRASGSGGLDDIAAVVLETNGKLSVITRSKLGDASALGSLRPGSSA
ncbi:DUF421 domain-containing protein [Agromyces sp. C10]|uniref:DUF421 domain-containing protein n=1 Tax=Agromyces sp. C10 TaxID=2935077 RepID=UPI00200ADAA2|nr:YetF domain-containing protein [Agromyces sp. C10]MCK8608452.1 DUF421 domain-containing protein [Agromyces sp. C10]